MNYCWLFRKQGKSKAFKTHSVPLGTLQEQTSSTVSYYVEINTRYKTRFQMKNKDFNSTISFVYHFYQGVKIFQI